MATRLKIAKNKSDEYKSKTTECKKEEAVERETEECLHELLDQSIGSVALLNEDGTIRYQGTSAKSINGYAEGELSGKQLNELVHPDDVQKVIDALNTLLGSPGSSMSIEVRFLHKNGSWRLFEGRVTNLLHNPLVKSYVFNYRDITEQNKLQELLPETQKYYRLLAENIRDVIFLIDMNLNLIYVSPSIMRLRGYSADEVMSADIMDSLSPASVRIAMDAFSRAMDSLYIHKEGPTWEEIIELQL